jgi:hypothetical protein
MLPRDRALLVVALGFLLLATPLYAFPHGGHAEVNRTYSAEETTRLPPTRGVEMFVLECDQPTAQRACVWALRVGYDDSVRLDGPAVSLRDDETGLYTDYEFVRFEAGYARPNATVKNGTVVLSFEPVAFETVAERFAWSPDESDPVAKRALAEGSASTGWYDRDLDPYEGPHIDREERFVRDGDTYYWLERTDIEYRQMLPHWQVRLLHIGGVLVGAFLVLYGRGRHARLVDEAREKGEVEPRYPF